MVTQKITNQQIDQILERLTQGKRVRRTLLESGRLNIDRKLPFLILYRPPEHLSDPGTSRLVKGEASYLIAPLPDLKKSGIQDLVKQLAALLSEEFGAYLIIEVWAGSEDISEQESGVLPPKPGFTLYIPQKQPPTKTVEVLERSLRQVRILKRQATVEVKHWNDATLKPATFSEPASRKANCFVLGLEINAVYRDQDTQEVFPLVLRRLHRSMSTALKRAAFEFIRNRTTRKPSSYQVLGRRAFVKAVWDVDKQLADISQSFDFLLQVSPINTEQAWRRFRRCRFEQTPILYYRPLPIDPGKFKRKLYQVPLERVEDPTLAYLFREKQMEIDRQLTMLSDRGKRAFFFGSLQLYGEVTNDLVSVAETILQRFSSHADSKGRRNTLNAPQFAERARQEIQYYQSIYPEMSSEVQIRDDIVGVLVSRGNFLIPAESKITVSRVEAILHHEIGTHVLTYFNGKRQPFQQLQCGFAGYDELQEGLAVLAEFFAGGLTRNRLRLLAGRVMAAYRMQSGSSFVEVYQELNSTYGFDQRLAFNVTIRIFRGGGFVKDAIYLRGLIKLLDYLKNNNTIDTLLCGKISLDHIKLIQELRERKIISEPKLIPRYNQLPDFQERLTALKDGLDIFDLVNWS